MYTMDNNNIQYTNFMVPMKSVHHEIIIFSWK